MKPIPEIKLDAAELAEMLQFLSRWLARDPGRLGPSLEEFVGHPAYGLTQLHHLERFVFLLGGSDGEPLSAPEPPWAATLSLVTLAEKVLDPGPIAYADIDLYGDPDLEHALREEGLDPQATTYRLIEIPLSSIDMVRSMSWGRMGTAYIDVLKTGQQFPPIVVFRNRQGWTLLDGVNRTHAHWVLGTPSIRAYDLLGS